MRPVLIGKLSKIILVKWWSIKNLNAKIQGGWPTCPGLSRSLLILTLKSPTSWGTFLIPNNSGQLVTLDSEWMLINERSLKSERREGRQPRGGPRYEPRPREFSSLWDSTSKPCILLQFPRALPLLLESSERKARHLNYFMLLGGARMPTDPNRGLGVPVTRATPTSGQQLDSSTPFPNTSSCWHLSCSRKQRSLGKSL